MTARSYVWLSIGGGAWGLASNWADTTDGTSPSASAPGALDDVTVTGPAGAAVQTITSSAASPGLAALARFDGNTALVGSFAFTGLALGQGGAGGLLELSANTILQSATATLASGSLLAGSGATLSVAGTLGLGAAGAPAANLNITGGSTASALAVLLAAGNDSIYVDPASILEVGGTGQGKAGRLTIDAGGMLAGQGNANAYGAVANNGTIAAQGGTLALGALSGSGTLLIGAGATLMLDGACGAGQAVGFAGANATLALAAEADAPAGTLTGYAAGDAIDIHGSQISSASFQPTGPAGGVLTLFYGTQAAATLRLAGSYAGDVFLTAGDGAGGTLITLAAAPGGGGPGPGTSTPDQYAWTGGASGGWGNAANWADTTRGQSPARIAPGVNDLVTLAGGQAAFTVIGGAGNAASLGVTGEVALSGTYHVGTLSVGSLAGAATPGTLDLLAGTVMDAATASIADGAISLSGSLATLDVAGTLTLGGGPSGVGLPVTALSVTAGAAVQAASLVLGGGSGDSIVTDPTGSVEVGTAGGAASGAVTIDAGAVLTGNGSINPLGQTVDNGTVLAAGGTLTLGTVSGAGALEVAAGATLELLAASAVPVTLQGTAATGGSVLAFSGARAAPTGIIAGLVPGDAIHLEGSPLTGLQFTGGSTGGTLALIYGTTVVGRLALAGSFAGMRFVLTPDSTGGSVITLATTTGGGGGPGQGGTDTLAWTSPVSGAWGRAASWTDQTTGAAATAPPGVQSPVVIAGPGGTVFEDITGQGTCASLSASGNTVLSGGFSTGQLGMAAGGALVLGVNTTLTATGATLANAELIASGQSALLACSGTLSLAGDASLLAAQSHGAVQGAGLVLAGGAVTADVTASVEIGTLGGAAAGALTIDAGFAASGFGALALGGTIIDNGTVTAQGGTLSLGNVGGAGGLAIGTGATLALVGTDACPVSFAGGAATLLLAATSLGGSLTGFAAGDAIVVGSTPIDSVAYRLGTGGLGTLTLGEAGRVVGQLVLAGGYAGQTFNVQPDGAGAAITVSAPGAIGPSPGTATPDQYRWTGGQAGSWGNVANWLDVTTGQNPAAVAPGLNNGVSIAGGNGTALQITGPADAALLALTGTVSLTGAYALGTLSVGAAPGAAPALLAIGAGTTLSTGAATIAGGSIALAGGALSVAGTLALAGAGSALEASGAALVQLGGVVLGGAGGVLADGGAASIEIGGSGRGTAGNITLDAGALITGTGSVAASGTIMDAGTIAASGGTLTLGTVAGTGTLLVGVGAELVLAGTASAALTADFAGAGTLSLGQGALAGAPAIAGFGTGDQILLAVGGVTQATYAQTAPASGVLTITSGTTVLAQLTLLGDQSGQAFTVTGTADGGTILTATPDKTTGQGGGFVTNPTTSGGMLVDANTLETNLGGLFLPEALTGLANLIDGTGGFNQTTYEWFSADGSAAGAPSQAVPTSVELVGPGVQAGTLLGLQAGYRALLVEGNQSLNITDNGLGNALLAGNMGTDSITAAGEGDTLVGGAGAHGTQFFATLTHPVAGGTPSGYDVVIHGSGNDTIVTTNDAAAVTTGGGGHSLVFLGTPQNTAGRTNSITLAGSDTVVCVPGSGSTEQNVTVSAAAGLAPEVVFGPAAGGLHFVGGASPAIVVGYGGQVLMQGGAGNGSVLWANSSAISYVGGSGSAVIIGGSNQADVQGGSGPVTVFGGSGEGLYAGAAGSVFVIGDGASTVTAAAGVGVFITGGANVSVSGSAGGDAYAGNSTGNNIFQAGGGNETLWGGVGNDLFLGGSGHIAMISGGGDDVFSFLNGANSGGSDTIYGFVPGQSSIELSGYGLTVPLITHAGADSILNLSDGTQITVHNVANLGASSIILH